MGSIEQDDSSQDVALIGMFEHIGVRNFPTYFGTVRRVLKPGGLFLNHGISSETGWQRSPLTRFMNRYIFPDGELAIRYSGEVTYRLWRLYLAGCAFYFDEGSIGLYQVLGRPPASVTTRTTATG